jgi:hypothetical protein
MRLACLLVAVRVLLAQSALTPGQETVRAHITENSLRGHVAFLASDTLEGRATPSAGQDAASEYIAAQFLRAGLEPAGNDGYFQTTTFTELRRSVKLSNYGQAALSGAGQRLGRLRNVAGLLRGSDPVLKDTYVILSAHYDHIGLTDGGPDQINNGANDNASGTASVIEVASALAALPVHPKRSILFLAFFGEELGLIGSRYYASHPLVPLEKTVVQLNLEQLGRTDASDGDMTRRAAITGFDFSSMSKRIAEVGKLVGIDVYNDPKQGDPFFRDSDNLSLADAGVPAHTLSVAYLFPDYHRPGDEWQKLNYPNLAATDLLIALAMMDLASDAPPPEWNAELPATKPYVAAAAKLHAVK